MGFILCSLSIFFFNVFLLPVEHIGVRWFIPSSVIREIMDTNISYIYLN